MQVLLYMMIKIQKCLFSGAAEVQYRQAAVLKDSKENGHLRIDDGDLALSSLIN